MSLPSGDPMPPRATDPERPLVLDPRPLEEPIPLPDCVCGKGDQCACWYGLMRRHGLGPTQSLLDALEEVVGRPRPARAAGGRR